MLNTEIETTTEQPKLMGVCQAFTETEIKNLHDEYWNRFNEHQILQKICTKLFRKNHIRTIADLEDNDDQKLHDQAEDIRSDFRMVQSSCVTKFEKRKKKVTHKKHDVMRDSNGDPITDGTNADGSPRYKYYTKDTVEYVDELEEVPLYDYKHSPCVIDRLEKVFHNAQVLPDFNAIRSKIGHTENFERGLELIREITKYYVFDDPEKFVRGFALLVCNAKAKGLNEQPKYPILFSIVSYDHGRGKGWFRDVVSESYDKMFECRSTLGSYKSLLDRDFNSIMLTRGFIKLDEKNSLDSKKNDELKTLITEPTVTVNRKHMEIKEARNLVTFFSCTNETVKDVVGLQQDRRIFESRLVDKVGEMPEEQLRSIMDELWRIMPCACPIAQQVIDEIRDDSLRELDAKMYEIISELFTHQDEFVKGKFISTIKMKECVKKIGNIRYMSVFDWCVENGIIRRYGNRSYGLSRKVLNEVLAKQTENERIVNGTSNSSADIEDIEEAIMPCVVPKSTASSTLKETVLAKFDELAKRDDIDDSIKARLANNRKLLEIGETLKKEVAV